MIITPNQLFREYRREGGQMGFKEWLEHSKFQDRQSPLFIGADGEESVGPPEPGPVKPVPQPSGNKKYYQIRPGTLLLMTAALFGMGVLVGKMLYGKQAAS